jgi:hypothetical protein
MTARSATNTNHRTAVNCHSTVNIHDCAPGTCLNIMTLPYRRWWTCMLSIRRHHSIGFQDTRCSCSGVAEVVLRTFKFILFEYVRITSAFHISPHDSIALSYGDPESKKFCCETLLVTNVRNFLHCELRRHIVGSTVKPVLSDVRSSE